MGLDRRSGGPSTTIETLVCLPCTLPAAAFIHFLQALRSIGDGAYVVSDIVANSREHGIPQNRRRVYIVGLLKSALPCGAQFEMPSPVAPIPVTSLLEQHLVHEEDSLPTTATGLRNLGKALPGIADSGLCH